MANVLEERGLFWWHDEVLPETQFAPDTSIVGTLRVDDEGRIELDLEGLLPSQLGPMAVFDQGEIPPTKRIAGLLKKNTEHVLLCDIRRNGGSWRTNNLSYERYSAANCLISNKLPNSDFIVSGIQVDLAGYEEWMRLGRITKSTVGSKLQLEYENTKPQTWQSEHGVLTISREFLTQDHGHFGSKGWDIKELAWMTFEPAENVDLDTAISIYSNIVDFLILITGSEYQPTWPVFKLSDGTQSQSYFQVNRHDAKAPTFPDFILSFLDISNEFGDIFFDWISKRAKLGPGIYLYTSTRKGMDLYEEHKFTNFMAGLESFHRIVFKSQRSAAMDTKIDRIAAQIQKGRDKKWFKECSKYFAEPNLERRLMDIFSTIPIEIDRARMMAFANKCASIRNDLAHRGHSPPDDGGSNSIHHVVVRNGVVSYFYHAKLLLEIGINEALVRRWLTASRDSNRLRWFMEQADLVDPPPQQNPILIPTAPA